MAVEKGRYFDFLVYPDSAPDGWWEMLESSLGAFARSPLHNPEPGEEKQHWHVMYQHGNPISLECAKGRIPSGIAANGYIELTVHPRNYQRYLIHMDQPEKQQFPEGSRAIVTCNGFTLDLSRDFSAAERAKQRSKVFGIIRDNGVTEYADLLDGLMDSGLDDLFDWAFNHTIALSHYLASVRGRLAYVADSGQNEVQGTESPVDD